MDAQPFETSQVTPVGDWSASGASVTLRVSATDARRIVRALEETSVSLGTSPSGSRLASSYIRLASFVRQQSSSTP